MESALIILGIIGAIALIFFFALRGGGQSSAATMQSNPQTSQGGTTSTPTLTSGTTQAGGGNTASGRSLIIAPTYNTSTSYTNLTNITKTYDISNTETQQTYNYNTTTNTWKVGLANF